ncbi:TetR/AcrR family transcriptional regulator [Pseudonocardia humida]|uniref:TetR family transcriptional regulator n=1 Tax=Pseudonocardia humida TaxID=2800819 RepID=A0ABT0ZZU9_9PSEU|nr:TetR/AcrR family transcriptional regulator [Pseudonocardia humida]MCO1656241.1 TetR family transcriptional regulator [Pseudonocardia humida]
MGRTVTGAARRAQIVAAAIETIAELGLGGATFARIAERAGLSSTRMISYHFAGRDDLVTAVFTEIYSVAGGFIEPFVLGATSPARQLRGVIEGNMRFYAEHRAHVLAAHEIWHNHRRADGRLHYGMDAFELELVMLSEIARAGWASGEFRRFDPRILHTSLRHTFNGVAGLLSTDPELDLDACTRELVALFEGATRSLP